jgi:hypothetical protein
VIEIRNICTLTAKEVAIYVSLIQFIVQREIIGVFFRIIIT